MSFNVQVVYIQEEVTASANGCLQLTEVFLKISWDIFRNPVWNIHGWNGFYYCHYYCSFSEKVTKERENLWRQSSKYFTADHCRSLPITADHSWSQLITADLKLSSVPDQNWKRKSWKQSDAQGALRRKFPLQSDDIVFSDVSWVFSVLLSASCLNLSGVVSKLSVWPGWRGVLARLRRPRQPEPQIFAVWIWTWIFWMVWK